MLNLTQKIQGIFSRLGKGKTVSENDLQEIFKTLKTALLEADVALTVVEVFISALKSKLVGSEIAKKVDVADFILKTIYDELVNILSVRKDDNAEQGVVFNKKRKPNIILMTGLQGSGKTTTTVKLAKHLKKQGKKILTLSLDLKRPAAIEQLEILSNQNEIDNYKFLKTAEDVSFMLKLCKDAVKSAEEAGHDFLIVDTAGRKEIDQEMMEELSQVEKLLKPDESIFVVDATLGRSSIEVAREFSKVSNLTGAILTRVDGDSKGGVALNIKTMLNCQVIFYGTGEKVDDFEAFYPERIASRMLDMGDLMTLVEKAQDAIGKQEMESMSHNIMSDNMNFNDLLKQVSAIKKMGNVRSMLSMIPGASKLVGAMDDSKIAEMFEFEIIIQSMTKRERETPNLVFTSSSRKNRIAKGSGKTLSQLNKMIKQFRQMKSTVAGMAQMARGQGGSEGEGGANSMLENIDPKMLQDMFNKFGGGS